ncbi:MAG TPA: hypothetical protein ENN36_01645 [Candidatus Bathyarchaeota archaeon]|nr:hypothetical protein [Candidatus Bathyarchaeota archaeon]
MAEAISKLFLKEAFPRALKAMVWGSVTFLVVYWLPMILYPTDMLPLDYATPLLQFAIIAVFFAVVGQFFSGTIIGCGFGVAKAIVVIAYFFAVSGGGVFSVTLPISELTVNLTVDISVLLLMIVSVNLINIAKNLLAAIDILSEKSTSIDFTLN